MQIGNKVVVCTRIVIDYSILSCHAEHSTITRHDTTVSSDLKILSGYIVFYVSIAIVYELKASLSTRNF